MTATHATDWNLCSWCGKPTVRNGEDGQPRHGWCEAEPPWPWSAGWYDGPQIRYEHRDGDGPPVIVGRDKVWLAAIPRPEPRS